MNVKGVSENYQTSAASTSTQKAAAEKSNANSTEKKANETGVVYESSKKTGTSADKVSYKKDNAALIQQLKADAEKRTEQMRSLVEKMMTKQGAAIGNADSMWKFLASGNYTVDAETKAQAQADIAEDGYWGVEKTSDRIVDFAKALAGNDPDKMDEMKNAFIKGFKQATKTWGKELPDISQRTYNAVMEKFDKWSADANNTDTDL